MSIAPPPSPQHRLDLPHRNRSTLTNSSDEAEPTRRHQGGSALTAAFYLLFDLMGLPMLDTQQTLRVSINGAVLTCPTGTTAPSPIPPMKPRPTRRHQRGSTLTAAFYLLIDLTGLPVLDTEQTWRVSIDGAVAGHIIHGVSPPRSEERRVGKECRSRWSPYH